VTALRGAALAAAIVLTTGTAEAQIEDSVPPIRHILAIDFNRVRPFHRSYDIFVSGTDSVRLIGRRDVTFVEKLVADSSTGWLLVESRTGVVSSVDSILLASDLRPLQWRSVQGVATLDAVFAADSMHGTIRVGKATSRIATAIPPDLVLSSAGFEMIAALLPLSSTWSDSANALAVTVASASVDASALVVAGEDSLTVAPGVPARQAWIVSIRSGPNESRVWVDRESGDVLRAQQLLPSHVGAVLEYRIRFQATTTP